MHFTSLQASCDVSKNDGRVEHMFLAPVALSPYMRHPHLLKPVHRQGRYRPQPPALTRNQIIFESDRTCYRVSRCDLLLRMHAAVSVCSLLLDVSSFFFFFLLLLKSA